MQSSSRREFLVRTAAVSAGLVAEQVVRAGQTEKTKSPSAKARIAITLDLEMSRNFPKWEDTHWDYQKGNLDQQTKDYAVAACRRVKERGGVIHTFVVGQVFEQENVDWLKDIAEAGHPIGNHTYDHVYLLAQTKDALQYRFSRAPWLIRNKSIPEILRENIELTNTALRHRVGVEANGFRTPGGFATALNGREDLQNMLLNIGFDWISCKYPSHAGMEPLGYSGKKPAAETFDNILAAQDQAQPFLYPTGLLEIPMSPVSDIGAFRNGQWQVRDFMEITRRSLELVIEKGAVFDFLCHPSCLGVVDPDFKTIDMICDMVDQAGDRAEIVGLDEIARQSRTELDGAS